MSLVEPTVAAIVRRPDPFVTEADDVRVAVAGDIGEEPEVLAARPAPDHAKPPAGYPCPAPRQQAGAARPHRSAMGGRGAVGHPLEWQVCGPGRQEGRPGPRTRV